MLYIYLVLSFVLDVWVVSADVYLSCVCDCGVGCVNSNTSHVFNHKFVSLLLLPFWRRLYSFVCCLFDFVFIIIEILFVCFSFAYLLFV